MNKIIGIDAGSEVSGVIVLENNKIRHGYNLKNSEVIDFIGAEGATCDKLTVIIEDVRPYNMRITDGIIQTIKFLGQIEWRLQHMNQDFVLISRWAVKQWIFLQYKSIAWPEIEKKIIRATKRAQKAHEEELGALKKQLPNIRDQGSGQYKDLEKQIVNFKSFKPRNATPTFVYVDDRIVANAMRKHWGIDKPKRPGERAAFGLKDHSWQALALCSCFLASK